MFLRLDDAEIPFLTIDGYLDIRHRSAEEVAAAILLRLDQLA
jgi:hypothetical protein